jgi:small-conductance mechanosensitive channel
MPDLYDLWRTPFHGNSVGAWTLAALAFLVTFTILPMVRGFISSRRRKWIQAGHQLPTALAIAALLVERTSKLFLFSVALYFGASQLQTLPPRIGHALSVIIVLTFWFQVGLWAMAIVRFAIDRRAGRDGKDAALASSIDIIVFIAGITVWAMAFLLALDNLGVEIKPLLAGLGITGIAVALAVQTVLGDLLASLSIALDKPFVIGDSLQVDDLSGTVEHIGVKSTRIRSVDGEQLIISNADLLKSRIRNNGRMRERRSAFSVNVSYDTSPEQLREIPPFIKSVVEAQKDTRFDRCHFLGYGDWALRLEIVYFVTVSDYQTYANAQQAINLAILERFREWDVKFAFPYPTPAPRPQPETGVS